MIIKNSVWLVVLNWRNGADTVDCLKSIVTAASSEIAGVVVCDNASGDNSVAVIKEWAASSATNLSEFTHKDSRFTRTNDPIRHTQPGAQFEMVLIHTGANLGFAGGNNVGIQYIQRQCTFDFVFLLNNDALLPPNTVPTMVARCRQDTQIGMCGCTVVYNHTPTQVQAYGGASYQPLLGRASHLGAHALVSSPRDGHAVEKKLDYILGAALMVTRPCLERIGGMEESYFLYYEEVDWATRAKRSGFTLAYAPSAVVLHKEGGTIGSSSRGGQRSLLSEYYLMRSRLLFTRKFYPQFLPTVIAFALAQSARTLLRRDWPRLAVQMRALINRPLLKAKPS